VILRNRSLLALFVAETVSTTGAQMTWLALPWFVLVTSGSATRMTLVMAGELIGLALLGLPGGRVLQHLGARRTMLVCDAARAPLMTLVPVLHWTGGLTFPALVGVAFGLGCLSAPYFAAQKVILPELLGEDEALITQANAVFQAANRITILLGPVLAGVLIGVIGAAPVLLVDAATYAVSVVLVAVFVPRRAPVSEPQEPTSVRAGLRFLFGDRLLRVWWPAFALGDAAWTAFFASVPVLVLAHFGDHPAIAGWLVASFGVGAVAGNVISYRVLTRRVEGLTVIAACVMGQALPLWLLPLPVPAWALSAALVASGIANGLVNPPIHSISTLRIPAALRPTVMTSAMVLWALVNPLGLFAAGPVLDAFGTTPVLVAFALTQTLMMGVVALAAARERGSLVERAVEAA
jgi:MFS family permease